MTCYGPVVGTGYCVQAAPNIKCNSWWCAKVVPIRLDSLVWMRRLRLGAPI